MATTTNNGWETPDDTDLVKDGALAMRTLGNGIDTSVGTGLLAWQSWAPTLGGGWLNGNGVWTAAFCQIGKTVHVFGAFTLGTTTTKGAILQITLPVAAAANRSNLTFTGRGSVAGSIFILPGRFPSNTSMQLDVLNTGATYGTLAQVSATVPATWVTGDTFTFFATYQAA
jgi:hypothetical protein